MSVPSIASYFLFRRIKTINQSVKAEAIEPHIQVQPNKPFQPIFHGCGQKAAGDQAGSNTSERSEQGRHPSAGHLSVSQSSQCSLPGPSYPGVRSVSSLSSGKA
ncbi:hypothetical protein D1BOALGB6SA_2030 [Olavius sp. associated proteobacterium Delta 1]|nr:hypothetical protein D1BOALGB6SA_2030 [Olavius sp. associated proteobacterium Delta 1]